MEKYWTISDRAKESTHGKVNLDFWPRILSWRQFFFNNRIWKTREITTHQIEFEQFKEKWISMDRNFEFLHRHDDV